MIQHPIKAIITDIEGTTTDIDFVHKVLFPYARQRLADFVRDQANNTEVRQQLLATAEQANLPGADDDSLVQTLLEWIDADRKATPLKALQGLIWKHGYEAGDFKGHLYPEVAPELERWQAAGIALYVYSSGSIQAQQLLFGYSDAGDLTPLFNGYFDTTIGQKRDVESYQGIIASIQHEADRCLFLSDVVAELDAANQAGLQTAQLVRSPGMTTGKHQQFSDFCQISQQLFAATSTEASL